MSIFVYVNISYSLTNPANFTMNWSGEVLHHRFTVWMDATYLVSLWQAKVAVMFLVHATKPDAKIRQRVAFLHAALWYPGFD